MFVFLLLVVCNIHTDACKTVRPENVPPDFSMQSCGLFAQQIGADWINRNPGYRLDRTMCVHGQRQRVG